MATKKREPKEKTDDEEIEKLEGDVDEFFEDEDATPERRLDPLRKP
jgi:hypothetical protein